MGNEFHQALEMTLLYFVGTQSTTIFIKPQSPHLWWPIVLDSMPASHRLFITSLGYFRELWHTRVICRPSSDKNKHNHWVLLWMYLWLRLSTKAERLLFSISRRKHSNPERVKALPYSSYILKVNYTVAYIPIYSPISLVSPLLFSQQLFRLFSLCLLPFLHSSLPLYLSLLPYFPSSSHQSLSTSTSPSPSPSISNSAQQRPHGNRVLESSFICLMYFIFHGNMTT